MDYKEKYEMALEGIQEILGSGEDSIKMSRLQLRLQGIFPELKESEDERIREKVIATIHLYYGEPLEDEAKEMIAWLEAQGTHANFRNKIQVGDKVTRNKDGVLVNLSQLKRVAKKQGENNMGISEATKQKLEDSLNKALEKETPESCNEFLDKQSEQNPAWSEEDEKKRNLLINILNVNHSNEYFKVNPANTLNMEAMHTKELVDWIKSFKNRVQPQPKQEWSEKNEVKDNWEYIRDFIKKLGHFPKDSDELDVLINYVLSKKQKFAWSEEDETKLKSACALIRNTSLNGNEDVIDSTITFLKSLKERHTWKPSDEQMNTLEQWLKDNRYKGDARYSYPIFDSLYQDLKKLKGE